MASPTAVLAGFLAGLETRALPERVRRLAAQHVLDIVAGVYASADIPEAERVARRLGGDAAAEAGRFATMAHAAESDPIHAPTTVCAGLAAVPPALLLAGDGPTATAAVVAGYEAAIRIGEALGSARLLARGWWPTAVVGGAGGAAAAARALGLDAAQTRNALSLALVQTGGLGTGGPEAPEARNLLAANAVRIGVEAAQAAAQGIAGPAEPLTGERGFLGAFGLEPAPDRLLAGLGSDWKIAGTQIKAFPCALQAQSALAAVRKIVAANGLAPGDIGAVRIGLPEAMKRIVDRPDMPRSRFAAAASLQFLAAALIRDGDILPARMTVGAAGRADDAIAAMMGRIEVVHDDALDAAFPASWPARVSVRGPAGEIEAETAVPPGHPDRPLDMAVTVERFRRYSADHLDRAAQDRLAAAAADLATLPDLGALTGPVREAI